MHDAHDQMVASVLRVAVGDSRPDSAGLANDRVSYGLRGPWTASKSASGVQRMPPSMGRLS